MTETNIGDGKIVVSTIQKITNGTIIAVGSSTSDHVLVFGYNSPLRARFRSVIPSFGESNVIGFLSCRRQETVPFPSPLE